MNFTANDWDLPDDPGTIRTRTGRFVNLLEPTVDMIAPLDIAHALSHVCRFGGHVPTFYSVAEHSLHVAAQLYRTNGMRTQALAGLLHDATEAYLGDMVRPLKRVIPEYRAIEANMAHVIARRFGLEPGAFESHEVKAADNDLLAWEMAMVRDAPWRTPTPPDKVADAFIAALIRFGGA